MSNSKKYLIKIHIPNYVIEATKDCLEEAIEDNDTECIEEFSLRIKKMTDWDENGAIVSTLEDYFNLIEEVEKTTRENVSVWNNGYVLEVGD